MESEKNDLCRLNKFIASANICSRRKAEGIILSGRVRVNGDTAASLGLKISPLHDKVELDGKPLKAQSRHIYIMLHKPKGCVTSVSDQFGRRTVMDCVRDINARLFPIGRLDYNTSGLLILTNDGDFAYKITHPRYEIEKTYAVSVSPPPSEDTLENLRRGVLIPEYKHKPDFDVKPGVSAKKETVFKTAPAEINLISSDENSAKLTVSIHEGRNRQIRKMCESVGLTVRSLHREKEGNLSLGSLKPGEYRHLTKNEVEKLVGSA